MRALTLPPSLQRRPKRLTFPLALPLLWWRFESGLRMSMHGAAGERGTVQVLPRTARKVGIVGNLYGQAGIEVGVRYLKLAMAMHRQAGWCAVASAYNSGVGRVAPIAQLTAARWRPWRRCDDVSRRAQGICPGRIRHFR